MSIARKAARGALWVIVASMGARTIGVVGTLVITRFLSTHQIGEVSAAAVLAMTTSWATTWGFGQYAIVKGRGADTAEVTWHATVAYLGLGAVSLGLLALLGGRLTPLFDAPGAAAYVPWLALAFYIRRIGAMPERVLQRQMKFRAIGISVFVGELSFTLTALSLASSGLGGWSIVIGNIVQSSVVVLVLVRAAGFASWATPVRLRWARFVDMIRFGAPLGIQGLAHGASRYWDNLTISYFFGPRATGAYNMAYNLADIPAVQVGEQIALVLMPSLAELPRERRPQALERSTALLSLIIFPLAVGLGLVAYPLVDLLLPSNDWQLVAPLLVVLACLSVFRPFTWVLSAYLEAESKTNRLMFLEVGKLVLLIAGIVALQRYGLRAASGAVGVSFGITAIAGVILIAREGPSPQRLLVGFVRPLLACAIMATAVYGVAEGLEAVGWTHPAVLLVTMIVTGAFVYVAAAFVVCRTTVRDLLELLRQARRKEQ